MGLEIVGIDMYPRTWVAVADQVQVFSQVPPLANAEEYEQTLLRLCRDHDVGLVVPLTDVEVDFLSLRASTFAAMNVRIATSNGDTVLLMRNKQALHDRFVGTKLAVIPTYRREEYIKKCNEFPCIAKPVNGRSSEGQFIFRSPKEFLRAELPAGTYVYQPFIGGSVLVVDVLRSHSGEPIFIARRELTRTKNGAGLAVEVLKEQSSVQHAIETFAGAVDFEGCINIELLQPSGSPPMLMDVNPRFSAGVAFSSMAGYDFVRNHIAYFTGHEIEPLKRVKQGAVFTRKYIEVAVES